MDVLISGNLTCLSPTLVRSFLRERYRVVLVSANADSLKIHQANVSVHSVSPAASHFNDIVSAHKFDVVVYLATREENLLDGSRQNTGEMLDGLLNVLELCKKEGIRRIYYLSSTEIYGNQEAQSESEEPLPVSPNGFTLRTGEQYCAYYSEQYGLAPVIVRVPFLYGQGEQGTFLHGILRRLVDRKKVVFPGAAETVGSFLHAEDVADFIQRSLDLPADGWRVVNLSSADPLTFGLLAEQLSTAFPHAKFEYDESRQVLTRPAVVNTAKRTYDWIAEHKLVNELTGLIEAVQGETKQKQFLLDKIRSRFPHYQTFLKWAEVILGAGAMQFLTVLSGSVAEFRFVDFRLAYVVLLGGMYGTQVALVAAALAGISYLFGWATLGLKWAELIYNVSNWLPFALYLAVGVISGYIHDKQENDVSVLKDQVGLIKEKYTFLYQLYQEVTNLKNQFHKQLVGFRDSFGRIYTIVRELDTLDEEEVIFQALRVLEDVMENRSIAIYSIQQESGQAGCYARLEIYSAGLRGQVPKSLNLGEYPELAESIEKGELFQNKLVKTGLPAYFVPIKNESSVIGAVAVWNAGFDQHSLYYSNLLTVLCGLIESSINRVSLFVNANLDKYYVPNTRIMYTEYFTKVLRVRNKIKKNKLGSHLVVKAGLASNGHEPLNLETFYTLVSSVTRAEDYTGILGDGNCYILCSQADATNAGAILSRLAQCGISGEIVSDKYPLSINEPGKIIATEIPIQRPVHGTGPLHIDESQISSLVEPNNGNHKTALPAKRSGKARTQRQVQRLWQNLMILRHREKVIDNRKLSKS